VKGLSQERLAAKAEVSRQTVAQTETGATFPRLETLSKLADVLGVDMRDLLGLEQDKSA